MRDGTEMKVFFRVDASNSIGSGHVMRCLTLANFLSSQGAQCSFISRELEGNLIDVIRNSGFNVYVLRRPQTVDNSSLPPNFLTDNQLQDAKETLTIIEKASPEWLVVDHYNLGQAWELSLRKHCKKLMVIDDLANRNHDCDLLLDQNLVADQQARYQNRLPNGCTQLLGPRYSLLQPQYAKLVTASPPPSSTVRKILVSFGGADKLNLTGKTIQAFIQLDRPDISLDVVISLASKHREHLKDAAKNHPNIKLHEALPSLAPLMQQADIAVGAGGCTSWERCCLGLPSLVITLAENQVPIAKQLQELGYISWLGDHNCVQVSQLQTELLKLIDHPSLEAWSHKCMQLVDGRGTERVADIMCLGPKTKLIIRPVETRDEQLLLNWANDPIVRENAFNQSQISTEDHHVWFQGKLGNPDGSQIFIFETKQQTPIGQVRFDKIKNNWEISYTLAPVARGRNLGSIMLGRAMQAIKPQLRGASLIGEVKRSNHASQKVFKKLGFTESHDGSHLVYRYSFPYQNT